MDTNTQLKREPTQPKTEREGLARKIVEHAMKLRRSGKFPSIAELIASARGKGESFGWEELYAFSVLQGQGAPLVVPPFIIRFLSAYVSDGRSRSVLDPWAGIGSLLMPLIQTAKLEKATGIIKSQNEYELARLMDETAKASWLLGAPGTLLDTLGDFDLVVSAPPFGLPAVTETFETKRGPVTVNDSETYVVALKAALHLAEGGEGIFLFPNNFFFKAGTATVREALSKVELFVNAIIALPAGTFYPHTSIESNLVFISRRETPDVFIGRLAREQDASELIKNLRRRIAGPVPELGRIIRSGQFVSWQNLVAAEEIEKLVQRGGLKPVALAEVTELITMGKRTDDGGFADLPNAVILPLIGTSPAVTSLSALQIKPQNCAQLVLRSDKVFAEFLAGFFNSSLGWKVRDRLLRGAIIPKTTKQGLMEATVYLAPIETQKEVVDVQREIRNLALRLGELQQDLWNRPTDARKVQKALTSLSQKESLESWLETLPFPLGSVLWRYQATNNVEHKNTHLVNFFEAAAQFLGTLMASAFHSNAQFFEAHKGDWFEAGKENPHSLTRSNFGDWVVRCHRLAKTTRQMLSTPKERELCLELFKTHDSAKIEAISSKAIYSILEKASKYRNDWKAHSGIVSAKEQTRRLTLLQEELTQLWAALGLAFEDWWLVRPGANEFTHGLYHFRAEKLAGSRQIFKQIDLATPEVMDSNELYFFDVTTRLPLQLLHFFRMMPAPETEEAACYFYNRLEKEGVRWVSYHFEGKAERFEPDPAILSLIREVEENNT
jgi:hypothetical protein